MTTKTLVTVDTTIVDQNKVYFRFHFMPGTVDRKRPLMSRQQYTIGLL